MDAFYRAFRTRTGLLMDADGQPLGGRLSFDVENRQRWLGEPAAPEPLNNLANAFAAAGRHADAVAAWRKATTMSPGFLPAWFGLSSSLVSVICCTWLLPRSMTQSLKVPPPTRVM